MMILFFILIIPKVLTFSHPFRWNSEGLPPDELSVQNGILTMRASRSWNSYSKCIIWTIVFFDMAVYIGHAWYIWWKQTFNAFTGFHYVLILNNKRSTGWKRKRKNTISRLDFMIDDGLENCFVPFYFYSIICVLRCTCAIQEVGM